MDFESEITLRIFQTGVQQILFPLLISAIAQSMERGVGTPSLYSFSGRESLRTLIGPKQDRGGCGSYRVMFPISTEEVFCAPYSTGRLSAGRRISFVQVPFGLFEAYSRASKMQKHFSFIKCCVFHSGSIRTRID